MSNRTFIRKKIKGLVFTCPKGAYRSVEAWLEAKAPDGATIYDTSTQLRAYGIPIVDAMLVDGVYYKTTKEVPLKSKITLPAIPSRAKLMDIGSVEPQSFPGLIYFDKSKHVRTQIGTAAPSKISKSK